jgi:TolA-binding protein
MRADLRFELGAWDEAAADYRELARRFPASYLAPIALFNAATCLEAKADREGAVKLYTDIVTRWKQTAVAARALFALGRLAEDAGTWDEAKSRYEQLDAEWPSSSWTQLAKNRLIALKVAGKIQ